MNISRSNLLTVVLRVTCCCVNDINTINKLQYLYYTTKCICPIEQPVSTSFTNFKNIREEVNGLLITKFFKLYKNKVQWNNICQAEVLHKVLTSIFHFSV
jgi:hypothetical protein